MVVLICGYNKKSLYFHDNRAESKTTLSLSSLRIKGCFILASKMSFTLLIYFLFCIFEVYAILLFLSNFFY